MKYGLRIPSFALGPKTAKLQEMGAYLRRAEDLGFDSAVSIDHLLLTPPAYACTWLEPISMLSALVPHSSSTPEQVKGDWTKVQGFAREAGRDPAKISRVYSNFVWVLEPGEKPESAVPHFSVYSGMDLEYWKTYYLLGEAADVADRISARIAALDGGVDTIVLNPLDWSPRQLELIAGDVLPKVKTTR